MIFSVIVSIQAKNELREIVDWYKSKSLQATENFFIEFDKTIDRIAHAPFTYRNVFKQFRVVKMKKYPYYIFYQIQEQKKTVIISKLYHTSRNPKNKFRNL